MREGRTLIFRLTQMLSTLVVLLLASLPCTAASRFPDICQTHGKFVWAQGKGPVSNEMLRAIINEEGNFTAGYCSCYDLRQDCEAQTPGQCLSLLRECNLAIGSGGSFCKANNWGGQTCYR